jgi:hypothetical protein
MQTISNGTVEKIIFDSPELQELLVRIEAKAEPERAYNYPHLNRRLAVGDRVLLNTVAVELGLGTGGRHFVIPQEAGVNSPLQGGHIMKLRYTPWQFPVLAAEEEESPFHQQLLEAQDLKRVPVVIAPLHSMLPGIILGFRACFPKEPRIAYIMTDGAALPIALSHLVRQLKTAGLLQTTITAGHSFGGDLETVGIPSALITAVEAAQADLIICALGPGIVGTGTRLGFSGIEQSWIIDLVRRLNGIPVVVPRLSTADGRERHFGLSHHTITILNLANHPALVGVSTRCPESLLQIIRTKAEPFRLLERHQWFMVDDPDVAQLFEASQIKVKTMGRAVHEDPWFFQSSITAGFLAGSVIGDGDFMKRDERIR